MKRIIFVLAIIALLSTCAQATVIDAGGLKINERLFVSGDCGLQNRTSLGFNLSVGNDCLVDFPRSVPLHSINGKKIPNGAETNHIFINRNENETRIDVSTIGTNETYREILPASGFPEEEIIEIRYIPGFNLLISLFVLISLGIVLKRKN